MMSIKDASCIAGLQGSGGMGRGSSRYCTPPGLLTYNKVTKLFALNQPKVGYPDSVCGFTIVARTRPGGVYLICGRKPALSAER